MLVLVCHIGDCLIVFPSASLFQSKEIAFQLQEDLMKVLNELYTVSSLLFKLMLLSTMVFAVAEYGLWHRAN